MQTIKPWIPCASLSSHEEMCHLGHRTKHNMRITLTAFMFVLAVVCVPVFCDQEEPPVLDLGTPPETRSRFALLDDVRLLANGLLQLGQSMRDFVQRTKGQINDIFKRLNIFDRSFYQLSALANEIKEEEEELKKTTVALKANNEEIKGLSEEISSKMDSILQEKSGLQSKVEGLEEKLGQLSLGLMTTAQAAEINSLRNVIHSQEQSIRELLKAMKEQSEQLSLQQMKIKALDEQLTANMLPFFSSEVPTLPPYQTPASPSSTMNLPSDCSELFDRGERASGVYAVKPSSSKPFMAFCDMSGDRGETVIQRRMNGTMNFNQPWERYENGFGDFQGEFWLGLQKIHSLTSQGNFMLHIQLEDWNQNKFFTLYRFYLDGPESNYTIHLMHLSGNLPDPINNPTGMMFSTKDTDYYNQQDFKCAHRLSGGWWLSACGDTNPNGVYFHMRPKGRSECRRGIQWRSSAKACFSVKSTQISISPLMSVGSTFLTAASSDSHVFS
ncbi:angiopoietin-related protein 3-like [Melanotaenia boesemani]|uniref:angiopoietin-related protein 3-like n=1 Tax=Melanotaenia boesemani TaxID=1250792 RepID=UPI001C05313C|nr:angiopoietin-related protein 3-like [Melanotaenia boesemani]